MGTLFFLIILGPGIIELFLLNVGYLFSFWQKPKERVFFPEKGVILIPAHNEEKWLPRLLGSLKPYRDAVSVIVIADNCTDRTEAISQEFGVEALVRHNLEDLGKPWALHWAFEQLQGRGFSHFFIVDADSAFVPDFFAVGSDCPNAVQSLYLLERGEGPFAFFSYLKFLAFNQVRVKAKSALGLSVGILGNGWLIKKEWLKEADLTRSLAEDLDLHLHLITRGKRVVLNEGWKVVSVLPPHFEACIEQSRRWERGRWMSVQKWGPKLLYSLVQGNFYAMEPLLDLLLFPLSLFLLVSIIGLFFSLKVAGLALLMLAIHGLFSLWEAKIRIREMGYLCCIPWYIVKKLWLMGGVWTEERWKKTPRE